MAHTLIIVEPIWPMLQNVSKPMIITYTVLQNVLLYIPQNNLYLVWVVFPDGFKLITNFSTRPALPSNRDKKSRGLESYEFLEIDPDFAKCLKINEGETVYI